MLDQSVSSSEIKRLKLLEVVAILVIIGLAASIVVPQFTKASEEPIDQGPVGTEFVPYDEG